MSQAAFGWWNSHLHEFRIGGRDYGVPDPDWDMSQVLDETRYRLDKLAAEGDKFRYVYDFTEAQAGRSVGNRSRRVERIIGFRRSNS